MVPRNLPRRWRALPPVGSGFHPHDHGHFREPAIASLTRARQVLWQPSLAACPPQAGSRPPHSWRPRQPFDPYSYFSAVTGSTWAARHAGYRHATLALNSTTTATVAKR